MSLEYYFELGIHETEKLVKTSKEWKRFVKDVNKRDEVWHSRSFHRENAEADEIVQKVLGLEKSHFTRNMALMCCNDEWPWMPLY